jgi:hypothetical protein
VSAIGFPLGAATGRLPAAIRRFLEQECFVLLVLAASLAFVAWALPTLVVQDSWLALVDGRYIAQHGLPHADELTVMTRGAPWVDQQWLAHLTLYGLDRVGGLRLALAAGLGLLFLALGLAAFIARRAGASARSVALVALLPLVVAPWLLQLRTQTLVLPLFVGIYGLLALDSRRPSARVWLVLPLLVCWANLHGSVVLAALLVVGHGLLLARRGHVRRGLVLAAAAPATVVASPYGFALTGYYRWMLGGSPLHEYVSEWRPATLAPGTLAFYVTALAIVFGLGRHGRAVSQFERFALPLLFLSGLASLRNGAWFALAAGVSAPLLVDSAWPPSGPLPAAARRLNRNLATCTVLVTFVVVSAALLRPASAFEADWPRAGADAVVDAAGPHGLVLADDVHSDWLLWEEPQLAGRIGYDVRFELLTADGLRRLYAFRHADAHRGIAAPYRVLTFGSAKQAASWRAGRRVVYADDNFVVLER